MSDPTTPQPPPRPAKGDVWLEVIEDVAGSDRWCKLLRDMRARREFGIAKYGCPVQRGSGRDHLVDAYQELLDAAVYLKAADAGPYRDVLALLVKLKEMME